MEAAAERLTLGEPEVERRGPWRQAARRFRRQKLAVVALAVLLLIFVIGALAGVIAPHSYDKIDITKIGKPPSAPSFAHPFGTDDLGHDMLSQTLYGIRTTEKVAFIVAGVAAAIGIAVGGIAGYYCGWADRLLSAITDGFVAMPALLAALIAVSAIKNISERRIALTLAIVLWPAIARVVRASFVSLREREYVEAARASGASDARIVFRHLLPNTAGVIIVAVTSVIGASIILEATVDYFNYGLVGALKPTLGSLLADATKFGIGNYAGFKPGFTPWWWLYVIPAIVIGVLLVCVNFVGDALDDALNPARVLR